MARFCMECGVVEGSPEHLAPGVVEKWRGWFTSGGSYTIEPDGRWTPDSRVNVSAWRSFCSWNCSGLFSEKLLAWVKAWRENDPR